MNTLETLVLHGSGWLEALDASGAQAQARRLLPLPQMQLRLSRRPADLTLVPQPGGRVALWRRQPATLRRTVEGVATPVDLAAPAQATFALEGDIVDPQGRFLPRAFAVEAGGGAGRQLRLYRSNAGTVIGREGGLVGRVQTAGGVAVPWALLTLAVRPPLADALTYKAQADAHGEFRLALQRLPAGTAPATVYPATLTVQASAGAPATSPDPDAQPAAQLRTADGPDPAWADALLLDVAPGRVATLASPGQGALVLQLA